MYAQAAFIMGYACMALGWALARRPIGGLLSGLGAAFGLALMFGISGGLLPFATEPSPTYALALPIAVSVVGLVALQPFRRLPRLALLSALAFGLVLARVPTAVVTLLAVIVAVGLSRDSVARRLADIGCLIAGSGFAYLLFIRGGPARGLELRPNLETASLLGLFPYSGFGAAALAAFALAAVGVTVALLAAPLCSSPLARVTVPIVVTASVAGTAFSLLTIQAGSSQITFLWAGLAIPAVLIPPMLAIPADPSWWRLGGVALVGVAIVQGWLLLMASVGFGGVGRWGLVIGIAVVALLAVLTSRHQLLVALALGGLVTGAAVTANRMWDPERLGQPSFTITTQEVHAGEWLKANANRGDIVATTRQCPEPSATQLECAGLVFTVGALSGLSVDVEGIPYSSGVSSSLAQTRAREAQEAALGDKRALVALADRGVDWLWVDRRFWPSPAVAPAYENKLVAIVRIPRAPELRGEGP